MKSQETLELLLDVRVIGVEDWVCEEHVYWQMPLTCPGCGLDLTAVKCNVIVLCNQHTREMLLSLPAAAAAAARCSSVSLLCHCSAAQVQLVWLCNHWVRLHSCTLPVLLLKLLLMLSSSVAWLGLKSSNFLSLELAWLGYLGLGTLTEYSMKNSANCPVSPIVHIISSLIWGNSGEKFKEWNLSELPLKYLEFVR